MTQFYIVEIQQNANGEYGHLVYWAFDEDPDKAQLKAESKYYQVLSAAAVSNLASHAAILFSAEGFPLLNKCYKHKVEPAPEPEVPDEEPEEPDEEPEEPEPEEEPEEPAETPEEPAEPEEPEGETDETPEEEN